jgi:hypothetical protein
MIRMSTAVFRIIRVKFLLRQYKIIEEHKKMECKKAANSKHCNCSYEPCPRKGICCECVSHHRKNGELPACYFPNEVEKTYDRSIERFVEMYAHHE